MTHPITPPPELVQEWVAATESNDCIGAFPTNFEQRICTAAAQWGADQELEACCEWMFSVGHPPPAISILRAARRPQPPSLKKEALLQLDTLNADLAMHGMGCDLSQIRRAIEELPDD